MKIRMIRTPARRPDRLEGQEYDVPDDEAQIWLDQKLAEAAEPAGPHPKPHHPKPDPKK